MISRPDHTKTVIDLLDNFPVVGLIGARQVGKTTLARSISSGLADESTFFDLENPADESRLSEPMLALGELKGLVVLDEIQRRPDLFPLLRVLADRPGTPARFLILGSASPDLMRQSAESLAGRIAYHPLGGFSLDEVGTGHWKDLWIRGGFPRAFLAKSCPVSERWRQELVRTHLERDIPALGLRLAPTTLRRFWSMLAHYHGQTWNGSELARGLGVTEKTVRHYLDILIATFMVRSLPPWHANLGKRQVKAPKVYLCDSGLLHTFLRTGDYQELLGHPKAGASWEGFALEQVVSTLGVSWEQCHFWALHSGAELDLLVDLGQQRLGFEFKLSDAPRATRSMHSALKNLGLERIYVIHAGQHAFPLGERITAVPLTGLRAAPELQKQVQRSVDM